MGSHSVATRQFACIITHCSEFASNEKMVGFHLLFSFLLLCIAEGSGGTMTAAGDLRDPTCPDPQDILPCVCSAYGANMDMDCSQVENEDQLARVFSANFPFTDFRMLTIESNSNLKVLREGDLGVASFTWISIRNGKLEEVQTNALSQSYSTVTRIDFGYNEISTFPFEELPLFTSLSVLSLYNNKLGYFPKLRSDTITSLNLGNNLMNRIPYYAVQGLPKLQTFYGYGNNVELILAGTFSGLPDLYYVYVSNNNLSHIPEGAIKLSSSRTTFVSLSNNNISRIEVGAITGLNGGRVWLYTNALTDLDEDVFRPFLEAGAKLLLQDNPLSCGCDIAWLVTNPDFMALLYGTETCHDGELVSDLDPGYYEDNC